MAGPVLDGRAEVTNVGWEIEEAALARAFPIGRVSLINDFYAVALGVPLLGDGDLLSLQRGHARPHRAHRHPRRGHRPRRGARDVTTAASITSCRAKAATPTSRRRTRSRRGLFLHLHERYGHVSWERVVSGMGLVNIFTFLGGEELDGGRDRRAAPTPATPLAARAFAIFVDVYGAEAGNMALRVLARGGVYLAGGIAAKNVRWFTDGALHRGLPRARAASATSWRRSRSI